MHASGVLLSAILTGRLPGSVRTLACQAFGGEKKAAETAAGFLSACAGLPYRGAEPEKARDGGARVAARPQPDGGYATTIGDVRYNLAVNAERELWVLSMAAKG